MGWGDCGDDSKGRPIGYSHSATCDQEGCDKEIDRGLSFACGGMHGETEEGCEGCFCERHLTHRDIHDEHGEDQVRGVDVCTSCFDIAHKEWEVNGSGELLGDETQQEVQEALAVKDTEIARLRAALAFVASLCPPQKGPGGQAMSAAQSAAERARAALAPQGEEKP